VKTRSSDPASRELRIQTTLPARSYVASSDAQTAQAFSQSQWDCNCAVVDYQMTIVGLPRRQLSNKSAQNKRNLSAPAQLAAESIGIAVRPA
jgi:hypothetical protein